MQRLQRAPRPLVPEEILSHVRRRIPRGESVDVDPVGRAVQRRGPRQVHHGAFGRAVVRGAALARQAKDRGRVDDVAAGCSMMVRRGGGCQRLLGEHLGRGVFQAVEDARQVGGEHLRPV